MEGLEISKDGPHYGPQSEIPYNNMTGHPLSTT